MGKKLRAAGRCLGAGLIAATPSALFGIKNYVSPSFGKSTLLKGAAHKPAMPGGNLEILVWNVHESLDLHGATNTPGVIETIKVNQPNVVCLQEVTKQAVLTLHKSFPKSSLYFGETYNNRWNGKIIGNAILSFAKVSNPKKESWFIDKSRPARGIINLTLSGAEGISISNTHFDSHVQLDRTYQALSARDFMLRTKTTIGCGDFNAPPSSTEMQPLLEAYNIATCSRADNSPLIEGVLYDKSLSTQSCQTLPSNGLSDHPAIVVRLANKPTKHP